MTAAEYKPFEVIERGPQDPIRSKDWNDMQRGLLAEIRRLRQELEDMCETVVLAGLSSHAGVSYGLDEEVRGEIGYGEKTIGLITRQWIANTAEGEDVICAFGIMEPFDRLYYWAGAENGDKNALKIEIEYMGKPAETIGASLFINDRRNPPTERATDNPWFTVIKSANDLGWYKYEIINPYPTYDVKYVTFTNLDRSCTPRIGNIIHLKTRLQPLSKF